MRAAADILARLASRRRVAERVMILLAHPDDETIGLGARLCRFDDALLVHITDGAPRDGEDARRYGFAEVADYAAVRRAELAAALQAGEAARVRTLCLGIPDKEAMAHLGGLSGRVAELLRTERPAALFTHCYEGGHPDHDAAAFAAYAGCRLVEAPPQIIEMPFYHRGDGALVLGRFPDPPGRQTCFETVLSLQPDDLRRKQAMVSCFATQLWLLQNFDVSVERFRLAPNYDFALPPHSGPLHYETLGWGIAGSAWRDAALRALRELRLSPACA